MLPHNKAHGGLTMGFVFRCLNVIRAAGGDCGSSPCRIRTCAARGLTRLAASRLIRAGPRHLDTCDNQRIAPDARLTAVPGWSYNPP